DTLPLPDALPSLETLPLGRVPVLGPQRFQSGHCVGHPLQEFTNRVLGGRGGRLGAAVGVVAVWAGRRAVAGTTVTAGLLGGHLGAGSGGVGVRRRVVPVVVPVVAILAVLPAGAVPLGPRFRECLVGDGRAAGVHSDDV